MGLQFAWKEENKSKLRSPVRVSWATYLRNFLASYLVSMVSKVLWSPEGLVEVRVSWPGHPRYQKKKQKNKSSDEILSHAHSFYFQNIKQECIMCVCEREIKRSCV